MFLFTSYFLICFLLCSFRLAAICPYINQTFTSTLVIDDNCVVDSCSFVNIIGTAIKIDNNKNITIRYSNIYNINGDGIKISGSFVEHILIENNNFDGIDRKGIFVMSVKSNNIIIQNNVFHNLNLSAIYFGDGESNGAIVQYNNITNILDIGISIDPNHTNMSIVGNIISDIGNISHDKSFLHGIRMRSPGSQIIGNTIFNIWNPKSKGIIIRSSGLIAKNIIYNVLQRGISYYPDQPPGTNPELIIENNMVWNTSGTATAGSAINLGVNAVPNETKYNIGSAIIRFNTFIGQNGQIVIGVANNANINWMTQIYGNIVVRPGGNISSPSSEFISDHSWTSSLCNLQSNVDTVDIEQNLGLIDLHIASNSSIAYGFCNGLNNLNLTMVSLPKDDIDGDIRGLNNRIDVGADRLYVTSSPTSQPTNNPSINPTNNPTNSISNPPTAITLQPTHLPTNFPTISPTKKPIISPTNIPTISPTNNPSKYPSINPTISPTINTYFPSTFQSNSPTPKPILLDLGSPSPTPGPTNNDHLITTDNNNNNNQKSLSNNNNSFTNGPIFFTIIGGIVALLLLGVIFCIYFIIKKRNAKINNIKNTFTNYNTSNAERAFSTSNVFNASTDDHKNNIAEKPRKTSISMQEMDPTDTNPQNQWETNPHDHADNGNYSSYIPNSQNNNGMKSMNNINGLMINNMAENVNNMINNMTKGGPNMDFANENENEENEYIEEGAQQNKILDIDTTESNGYDDDDQVLLGNNQTLGNDDTESDEQIIDQIDDEIIIGDDNDDYIQTQK